MKLSRVAVVLASAAAVLAPVAPGGAVSAVAGWDNAVDATPAIFEDPFGFAPAYIDNPRFNPPAFIDNPQSWRLIFENPFDF